MFRSMRHTALAAALVLGASAVPAIANQPAMISAAPQPVKASKRNLFGSMGSSALYGRKSARITAAQQKRVSRKARNVARNRRHHRG